MTTQQHKWGGLLNPFGVKMGRRCGSRPPSPGSPVPSPLELTAYHEAGHAVFACLQGWRVPHATIIPRWRGSMLSLGQVEIKCSSDVDTRMYAKFILSGLAGEASLLGTRAFQVKKEFHEADAWLRAHMSEKDAIAAMFDIWHELMDDFAQKPMILAVMRVAAALLDRNSVKYQTVLEIVDGAYRLSGPALVTTRKENRRSGLSRRTFVFTPKPVGKDERRSGEERRNTNPPNTGGPA